MFPSLRPLLNKGGAGRYISRAESVERLQPMAARHLDLLYAYSGIVPTLADSAVRERLDALMPYLRTEVAKIYEPILSLGGSARTGVDRAPGGTHAGLSASSRDADRVQALIDAEHRFAGALRDEIDVVHHQERTRAILGHNAEASDSRLGVLREIASDFSRG